MFKFQNCLEFDNDLAHCTDWVNSTLILQQVLHYSSIQINPRKDGESFYLPYDDLPHMINPIEAKLGKLYMSWILI